MKWLRETRNFDPNELKRLDEALARFYQNPPKTYYLHAGQANVDCNAPDHLFYRNLTNRARPGTKIPDLGCEPANACLPFTEKGAQYTRVDLSEENLEANKAKYPKCQFLRMHWRYIPRLGAVYDIVTSFFVLEHVVYPREVLEAYSRCVRPGGLIAAISPDFLDKGSIPSQHFFGRKAGGIKAKTSQIQWIEASIKIFDRYVVYPRLIRKARSMAKKDGALPINLRPVCLEVESWDNDWDAAYWMGEDEVSNHIENLEFTIIERGTMFRNSSDPGTYPRFCYVLGPKS